MGRGVLSMLRIVVVEPGRKPYVTEIEEDLHIYKSSNKGFQTFREAEDWTLMMLADRFPRHNIPLSLRVNQAVYTRNMKGGEWDGE